MQQEPFVAVQVIHHDDIDRATSVVQVMEHLLGFLGRKNLERVFPARP